MEIDTLSNAEKKVAVKAELIAGGNARKLATKYGIHYSTVVGYRNEMREGNSKDVVLEVAETKEVALAVIANNIKEQTEDSLPPKKAQKFNMAVDELVEGVSSLQLLDKSFHKSITGLLSWADNQIDDDMDIKLWEKIAYRIGELHKCVFANEGVSVNVQQNNNSGNSFTNGMVN